MVLRNAQIIKMFLEESGTRIWWSLSSCPHKKKAPEKNSIVERERERDGQSFLKKRRGQQEQELERLFQPLIA